jgi:hypothetical protein
MCANLKEKLESLDKKSEDVHGDVCRTHINLQDREKLLVET